MYRVVLIDNEPWILRGMETLMPWQAHGFAVVGTYTDPVEAFEAILQDPPELIVIDIRMPEMDGLTLLERARLAGVASEFIIVSGYAEFDYVKSAMPARVCDYLLKPVEPGEMGNILARLSAQLSARMESARAKAAVALLAQKDFRLLFGGSSHAHYLIARIRGVKADDIKNALDGHCLPEFKVFPLGDADTVIALGGDKHPGKQIDAALEACAGQFATARIGLSNGTASPLGLSIALDEAEAAAYRDFIDSSARYSRYTSAPGGLAKHANNIALYFILRQHDNLQKSIQDMLAEARRGTVCLDAVADFWNRLAALINTERTAQARQREMRSKAPAALAAKFGDIDAMCDYLKTMLLAIIRESALVTRERGGDERFYDLLDEIAARYEKQLVLGDLAKRHHLNISYCCKLFKRQTGGTFSDYLIHLRLKHARNAIQLLGLPAADIYQLVGYSDLYYFRRSYHNYFGEIIQ